MGVPRSAPLWIGASPLKPPQGKVALPVMAADCSSAEPPGPWCGHALVSWPRKGNGVCDGV